MHIMNTNGELSRSSFIPFCSFGGKFIGNLIDDFNIPVCNIFKQKVYMDQLCFESNLQDLKESNSNKLVQQLEKGLSLVLDYNEERQIQNVYQNDIDSFSIFLDTISKVF